VASALADAHREDLIVGRKFWKMSGSGNDFVVFDARRAAPGHEPLERPEFVRALCARRTGVGADGVVFITKAERPGATLAMRYYNSDGSRGAFCGNATLCVTGLSQLLGLDVGDALVLETDAGPIPARAGKNESHEIDLQAVTEVTPEVGSLATIAGERKIGYALAGVPHLVVRCENVDTVDVDGRGRALRYSDFRADGTNVNFVSSSEGRWRIRTFERGVEGETLACGSGAVATAILLATWGESGESTSLLTASGRNLSVRLRREGASWLPSLGGEGRIVFTGAISELAAKPDSSAGAP
jgi:diaminopimelate epimerase